jgi:hypothetical protein
MERDQRTGAPLRSVNSPVPSQRAAHRSLETGGQGPRRDDPTGPEAQSDNGGLGTRVRGVWGASWHNPMAGTQSEISAPAAHLRTLVLAIVITRGSWGTEPNRGFTPLPRRENEQMKKPETTHPREPKMAKYARTPDRP